MPLSDQHLVRIPAERKIGAKSGKNKAACKTQFNRADMLLQSVIADIVNGYTRNDIILKFKNKEYEYQKKAIGEAQAMNYINMAYKIMQEDRVQESDKLRDQLYAQYLMLYNDCVVVGNSMTAKQILDSIAKIFLPDEKIVNFNAKVDGELEINFNFDA